MRSMVGLLLACVLTTGAWAQEMPCGGACDGCPPGGSSSGTFNPGGGVMLGPQNNDRNDGPAPRFRNDQDVLDYVQETYGNKTGDAHRDPRVEEYLKGLSGESRYIFQDKLDRAHDYSGDPTITRVPGTATSDYYCHDFAWRGGDKSRPPDGHLDPTPIVADPTAYGYTVVDASEAQAGDIVVYSNGKNETASHSGLVIKVVDGQVQMMSKDVNNSLFRHSLDSPGGEPNFFRDAYGGNGVTVLRPGPNAVPPVSHGAPPPAP